MHRLDSSVRYLARLEFRVTIISTVVWPVASHEQMSGILLNIPQHTEWPHGSISIKPKTPSELKLRRYSRTLRDPGENEDGHPVSPRELGW